MFLTASSDEERAHRRVRQNVDRGVGSIDYDEVLADLRRRDEHDSSRATSPLRPADDAVRLDSTGRYIEDVIDERICCRGAEAAGAANDQRRDVRAMSLFLPVREDVGPAARRHGPEASRCRTGPATSSGRFWCSCSRYASATGWTTARACAGSRTEAACWWWRTTRRFWTWRSCTWRRALRSGCASWGAKTLFGNAHGLVGQILSRVGAFPVKRDAADRTAIKRATRMLKNNEVVGILPEGTRRGKSDRKTRDPFWSRLRREDGHAPILPMTVRNVENT